MRPPLDLDVLIAHISSIVRLPADCFQLLTKRIEPVRRKTVHYLLRIGVVSSNSEQRFAHLIEIECPRDARLRGSYGQSYDPLHRALTAPRLVAARAPGGVPSACTARVLRTLWCPVYAAQPRRAVASAQHTQTARENDCFSSPRVESSVCNPRFLFPESSARARTQDPPMHRDSYEPEDELDDIESQMVVDK
ncbi:hypothetical protein AURDEDRAFT_175514 [Auricularia subglabra TFB-10046 SS5]|uniref:Uncharacterized protein n=1 Tax=Auricularia subglabra (strain TFB-10046 / SS5) TaxID=717982 RepID=J0WRR1_AURST|nr:hypothetical protein AURDEDRAFT_175514 [Auricularia subglabra TFB-10046 SS5]